MSNQFRWMHVPAVAGLLGFMLAGCSGDTAEEIADVPIIVEESGSIALAEPEAPIEDEIDIVEEEPQVVTRTIIIREPAPAAPAPAPVVPAPEPETAPEPEPVRMIPAGTTVQIALVAQIDSEHNEVGESWSGRVANDVVVDGEVVIERGAAVSGVVVDMDEGDRNGGQGSITLEVRSIETRAGTRAVSAAPVVGGHSYEDSGFPTKETGIGAGAGAVIGGIIGGKKGALIGAAVGGAGGAAVGAANVDYEVAIDAGTELTIRLENGVSL